MKNQVYTLVCGRVSTNSYIVFDENKDAIIFDIPDSSGEIIADFCDKNDLKPLAVFLTHGHFDHCGGVAAFLKRKNVPVYGCGADEALAMSAEKNHFRVPAENCKITNFVQDGEVVRTGGFEVSVMFTPGHTAGSVCYFVGDDMFSGDTLFCDSIGRTDFPESDASKMAESLKKIAAIDKDYNVYPGHEESTTLFAEQKHNIYLK